jgi:murein DD-endopeptidase MepM/ murein hydrolase activator NlpD
MEENGIMSYLEIVFDSTSFSDLLARLDFVGDIMRADARIYEDLQNARNETEARKDALEVTKAELNEEREYLEQKEIELGEQLEEAHALILRLQSDAETARQLFEDYAAEEARVQREINTAVARLRAQEEAERLAREARERERQQQQQQAQSNSGGGGGGGSSVTGSGKLMWPSPGRAISEWGAPRDGGRRLHQGLDIGGPHGQHVYAAESGTVITVSYGSGYGNYVTISHGGGMNTLYSHLSSSIVTVGTQVTRGQLIGYVGSTGNATTPHLHFEVFINGVRVNPRLHL